MSCLVVATRNRGKLKELQLLLAGVVDEILCPDDLKGFSDTVEDGDTFEENALKKAREAALYSGLPALADDSGLIVEVLGGRPGVHSARFAGVGAGDAANNARLLVELSDVTAADRLAAFVCVLAYVAADGSEKVFYGQVGGRILQQARGECGFGYDPLFLVDGFDRTMAELSLDEKNAVSHRGLAFRQFREYCEKERPD